MILVSGSIAVLETKFGHSDDDGDDFDSSNAFSGNHLSNHD